MPFHKFLIVFYCLVATCQAIAPLRNADLDSVIEGEYLIMLKPGSGGLSTPANIMKSYNFGDTKVYYLQADDTQLAKIRNDPNVVEVQANAWNYHALCNRQTLPEGLWGLSRLSSRALHSSETFNFEFDDNGAGTRIYVLDTGIFISHNDFQDRASYGYDVIQEGSPSDLNGHGTHVAATAGGLYYGVAKETSLIAVKVLGMNGIGTAAGIIEGIQWAHNNGASHRSVINMSLGFSGIDNIVWVAIANAYNAGLVTVVSAGNFNTNACEFTPAFVPEAITVAASTHTDQRAAYSNWGPCVNVFAPGSYVLSAWIGSPDASLTHSGTSMASPHVAGWVARYMSGQESRPSPHQVLSALMSSATENRISDAGPGTPNLLPHTTC